MAKRRARTPEQQFYQDAEAVGLGMVRKACKYGKLPMVYVLADDVVDDGKVVVCARGEVSRPDLARVLREMADRVEDGRYLWNEAQEN